MKRNTVITKTEHVPQRSDGFSWDEIRYFMSVCETGSFRAASITLGVSTNQVRRKIEALETELSAILFIRSAAGVEMTPDARSVYSVGIEIQEQVGYLNKFAVRKSSSAEGLVRLTITEGLGTFWITPKLQEFGKKHPRIRMDLRCEMRIPDLSRLESDVAVQLEKPRNGNLICRKIATLHFIVYGSRRYIEEHGAPRYFADLPQHRLIHLVADQVMHHILDERAQYDPQLKFATVITNTASAQVMAIADGAGIGVLPSYAGALSENLIPIETELQLSRPIWLVYNPAVAELKRVRTVIDWLVDAFDSKRYPWFRDEFIAPSSFQTDIQNVSLFQRSIGWRPDVDNSK